MRMIRINECLRILPVFFIPGIAFAAPRNFKELVNLALYHINFAIFALTVLGWFTVFAYLAGYLGAGGSGDEKKMAAARQVALFGILGLVAMLVYWGVAKIICISLIGTVGAASCS